MFSCDKYSPHSSLSLCLNIWLLSRKLLHSIFKIVWLVNTFDSNFFMLTHDLMQHLKVPKRTSTIDAKFLSFVLDFQLFFIWISIFGFAYAVRKLRIIFFLTFAYLFLKIFQSFWQQRKFRFCIYFHLYVCISTMNRI